MLLTAENIYKRFPWGDTYLEVLKGVDLSLDRGELAVLWGASGSGKSTLLHILGGIDRLDSGSVKFDGQPLEQYDDEKLDRYRNQRIGFVFQMHYLMPDFTAMENVMIPAMIAGTSRARAAEKATSLLSDLSLVDRYDHYPSQLSGGEQQRVAVARALVNDPALILADEPTGNLDQLNGQELLRLFDKLAKESDVSVLVATHDPEIASFGGKKYVLYGGKIENAKNLANM